MTERIKVQQEEEEEESLESIVSGYIRYFWSYKNGNNFRELTGKK